MAVSLTHTTVAVGTDAGNGEIAKLQWNEEHTLTLATDKLLGRATAGTGAVEEISCTAAGRAILDDADAAAQRTTLGLAIGTDVQAYDGDLDAIAALAGTSGFLKKTAANTWSLDTSTYITTPVPAGTAMLFQQTAAPTGWTKQTTHNDKALRVVSATASSGGTTAFSSVFASRTPAGTIANTTATGTISNTTATGTVGSTTLSTAEIPAHAHQIVEAGANSNALYNTFSLTAANTIATSAATNASRNDGTGNTGGGGSHTHSFTGTSHGHTFTGTAHNHTFTGTAMDFAVQYVDVIIATKD